MRISNMPKPEDFYDPSDPRGMSTSEFEEYRNALEEWQDKEEELARKNKEKDISKKVKKKRKKYYIYLDDVRIPLEDDWIVVKDYDQFVSKMEEIGFDNIALVSLDHDLGISAMREWATNVYENSIIDYGNITEKTGLDCAKWIVEKWMDGEKVFPIRVHSANAVGSANIMGYVNNYLHKARLNQDCIRWVVPHRINNFLL